MAGVRNPLEEGQVVTLHGGRQSRALRQPHSVCVDYHGDVFVYDVGQQCVKRIVLHDAASRVGARGDVEEVAVRNTQGTADGAEHTPEFIGCWSTSETMYRTYRPCEFGQVCVDRLGTLYSIGNGTQVVVLRMNGERRTVPIFEHGKPVSLPWPQGLAVEERGGSLYVVLNTQREICKLVPIGDCSAPSRYEAVRWIGRKEMPGWSVDGWRLNALCCYPNGVCVLDDGSLLITSLDGTIRHMDVEGVVRTLGMPSLRRGCMHRNSRVDPFEHTEEEWRELESAKEQRSAEIKILSEMELVHDAGEKSEPYYFDGQAFRRSSPCVDAVGNIVIADSNSDRIVMVDVDGGCHVLAGGSGYRDGPVDSAMFNSPTSVAIDRWGNLVIADQHNSAVRWMRPRGVKLHPPRHPLDPVPWQPGMKATPAICTVVAIHSLAGVAASNMLAELPREVLMEILKMLPVVEERNGRVKIVEGSKRNVKGRKCVCS